MIALDTNIIVRYLLGADDAETRRCAALIEDRLSPEMPGYITAITLCEVIWICRHRYGFGLDQQQSVIRAMLDTASLQLEHEDCVRTALESGHADLADALIHAIAVARGCTVTVTLGRKFARLRGVELLA